MNLLHFYDIRRLYLPRTSYKCVYKSFYDNLQCPSKVMCSINDNDNNNFLIMKKNIWRCRASIPVPLTC